MEKKDARLLSLESNEESRRDFLKKAGKMALYTPPAIMLLMHPGRNALACSVRPSKYNGDFGRSGPSKGGPFKGGPSKGGPFKGGPSKGGPFKGGPSKGGPSKGGPFKSGPFKGDKS